MIHGIPEEREENTGELALDIFNNKLGLGVDLSELDRTHRLGPEPVADDDDTNSQDENERKIRPIIVKFLSYRVRSTVIKARRNLKGEKVSITEALVKGRRDLLRKAQERMGFRNAWPYDGKSLPKEITLLLGSTAFMTFQLNLKLSICKTAVVILRQ